MSAHGCESAAANASASVVVPSAAACCLTAMTCSAAPGSVRRPLASASLMMTPHPDAFASARAVAGRRLEQVPRGLHHLEQVFAVHLHGERATDRRPPVRGPLTVRPIARPPARRRSELVKHRGILEHAALQRRRVNLVQPEAIAEQRAAFDDLPLERVDRQVLDLLRRRVDTPRPDVGVAPLGSDRDGVAGQAARRRASCPGTLRPSRTSARRPRTESRRRTPRRASRGMRRSKAATDAIGAEVPRAFEVDVRGPAQRRQPQPDAADRSARSIPARAAANDRRVTKASADGDSSPSSVGMNSETVGWMCIARCSTGYGAFAYITSRTQWITSSPPVPSIAAPRISCVFASTTIFIKPLVSPFSTARPTRLIGRLPTSTEWPLRLASDSVRPARPSGGSM